MIESVKGKRQLVDQVIELASEYNVKFIEGYEHLDLSDASSFRNMKMWELKSIQKELIRDRSRKIVELVIEYGIKSIEGYEHIDFLDDASFEDMTKWEIELILEKIHFLGTGHRATEQKSLTVNYVDALKIVNKYKNGVPHIKPAKVDRVIVIENDRWHPLLSEEMKKKLPSWKSADIDTFYIEVKNLFHTGQKTTELMILISQLSELINEREKLAREEQEEVTFVDPDDNTIADLILFRVEMIVQPHIDVIDMNIKSGGKLIFADIWELPFKESLKSAVRERDGNQCAICESETNLHVHHKIPRNLGGVNHEDNLVTLCSSCHGVVETADIQKAFRKSLSNYKKTKAIKSINWDLPLNKRQIKLHIEQKLDLLLNQLSSKNSDLAQEVVGIMVLFEQLHHAGQSD